MGNGRRSADSHAGVSQSTPCLTAFVDTGDERRRGDPLRVNHGSQAWAGC
jgi:hypothetical protein